MEGVPDMVLYRAKLYIPGKTVAVGTEITALFFRE